MRPCPTSSSRPSTQCDKHQYHWFSTFSFVTSWGISWRTLNPLSQPTFSMCVFTTPVTNRMWSTRLALKKLTLACTESNSSQIEVAGIQCRSTCATRTAASKPSWIQRYLIISTGRATWQMEQRLPLRVVRSMKYTLCLGRDLRCRSGTLLRTSSTQHTTKKTTRSKTHSLKYHLLLIQECRSQYKMIRTIQMLAFSRLRSR